ncbi:hypothetical protein E4U25_005822 [Claviceps purpurea]|nr:hypothetical protein E4U26_007346 [Claviceps purpurea]KAG6243997.1 hypothetical protein E4U25_005822 [Claviceps purpurea]
MADKPTASANSAQTSTTFDKNKQALSSVPRRPSVFSSFTFGASSTSSSFSASTSPGFASINRRVSQSSMPSHSHLTDKLHGSMAPPPAPMPSMEHKRPNIASLMSPPEAVLDNFHQACPSTRRSSGGNGSGKQATPSSSSSSSSSQQPLPLPMSPPVSPYSKLLATAHSLPATIPSQMVKDPVLYPIDEHSPASPPAQQPLFAPAEFEHHQRIVDEHVKARSQSIFGAVPPPRREDYELVLTFRSQVMKHYTADRKGWLRKERALLEADRRAGAQRYHALMPAKPIAAKPPHKHRADRVSKPQARPIRTKATTKGPSPRTRPAGRTSATPEPTRRAVAPNREDKNFRSIVDYCPPLDTLPDRANSLKVDWKGSPIDVSCDPSASLLHPDEIVLAGILRLDCATYLTSKRRIFERRLQCYRTGKEFRKTDAQQACKIDVNKASKLWTAFDKVGWLDPRWISQFL